MVDRFFHLPPAKGATLAEADAGSHKRTIKPDTFPIPADNAILNGIHFHPSLIAARRSTTTAA